MCSQKNNLKQRLPQKNTQIENSIWIHTSTVSEVNAIRGLLKKLIEIYNKKTFLITCLDNESISAAKEISSKLIVYYFPLNIKHIMTKAFKVFNPTLILLVEADLPPCLLSYAHKKKIPMLILNAKISDKTYRFYNRFKWFFRKQFSAIKMICAQSKIEENKYKQLKFKNVTNARNLKFFVELPEYETHVIRHAWNYQFNDFIVTLSLSQPHEELMMKELYYCLKKHIPRLKIIIIPKQLHRISEILKLFEREEYALFSESNKDKPFLFIDEMGVLEQIYALSDVVLIGGSFYDFGGHNPIEAMFFGKTIVIGQFYHAFAESVEKLLSENAIFLSNIENISDDIIKLYQNSDERNLLGKNAKSVLSENKDALIIHKREIEKWIMGNGKEIGVWS